MNCDQAFDFMTDPLLDDSAALHEHFEACPRCRQMYETLSPALGLFEGTAAAVTPDSRDSPTSVEMAANVAVRLREVAQQARPLKRRSRIVAACVAIGVLGLLTVFGIATFLTTSPRSAESFVSECTWQNRSAIKPADPSHAVVLSCVACHLSPSPE